MRVLTDHIVEGDSANQLTITVVDEPGQGGAYHEYLVGVYYPAGSRNVPLNKLENIVIAESGAIKGVMCAVSFQNGPIKEFGVNGITQEVLLAIVIDRLRSFQAGQFASVYNQSALESCENALKQLQHRTRERIKRGVEGTNEK